MLFVPLCTWSICVWKCGRQNEYASSFACRYDNVWSSFTDGSNVWALRHSDHMGIYGTMGSSWIFLSRGVAWNGKHNWELVQFEKQRSRDGIVQLKQQCGESSWSACIFPFGRSCRALMGLGNAN